jgi:hypothetical protein
MVELQSSSARGVGECAHEEQDKTPRDGSGDQLLAVICSHHPFVRRSTMSCMSVTIPKRVAFDKASLNACVEPARALRKSAVHSAYALTVEAVFLTSRNAPMATSHLVFGDPSVSGLVKNRTCAMIVY